MGQLFYDPEPKRPIPTGIRKGTRVRLLEGRGSERWRSMRHDVGQVGVALSEPEYEDPNEPEISLGVSIRFDNGSNWWCYLEDLEVVS